jgi:hypothetical protein
VKTIYRTAQMLFASQEDYDPALLLEAREKGYTQLGLSTGDWYSSDRPVELLRRVGQDAARLGMQISVLTGYQRYAASALAEHPEWRMVFEDGSLGFEACPFHEEYLALYVEAMRRIAAIPAVQEIQLNDEAHLTDWGQHWGCYCARCSELFQGETGHEPPRVLDWASDLWRRWIRWRLDNWVRVHREMYDAIKQTRPEVLLSAQFDPAVCLRGWNPWFSGVDIAAMADVMDLLRVDPYHTYHRHDFRPDISFLPENVRYLKGAIAGKPIRVWTQGMTWPEFSRPLTGADGRWTAALPLALGAEATTPWAYPPLQERPEVAAAYEDSFRWDRYYAQTEPVRHVAVIQGWQTKVWLLNEQREGRATYDVDYFRPACYILRRAHVLYDHLWDRRLAPENLAGLKAVVLPRVSCLSREQGEALKGFAGGIVATSDTGCYDQEGRPAAAQALEPWVRVGGQQAFHGLAVQAAAHPLFAGVQLQQLPFGVQGWRLDDVGAGLAVLATFLDAAGQDTGLPAIVASTGGQRFVYLAFEPWRVRPTGALRRELPALCAELVANAARWAAGGPPTVWMQEPAPKGVELFLGAAEGLYLVTLGNYYLDDETVTLNVALPAGERLRLAYDAEAGRKCEVVQQEGTWAVQVPLGGEAVKIVVLRTGPAGGS